MKMNTGKRVLMFFHWLFSLLICAAFVIYLIWPDFATDIYNRVSASVGDTNVKIIGVAILAIYLVLAVLQIILIFRRVRRAERGFITVDSSDTGRVRISVSAIEQMVRQSVTNIEGITDMKISIANQDDAIVIGVAASIINGSHVPTITMNMQRSIRQFVEMNCGVAVRSVGISIKSVTNPNEPQRRWRRGGEAHAAVPAAAPALENTETAPAYEQPAQPQAEPVFTSAPTEEDTILGIDFNYKPRLELTHDPAPEEAAAEETPIDYAEPAADDAYAPYMPAEADAAEPEYEESADDDER